MNSWLAARCLGVVASMRVGVHRVSPFARLVAGIVFAALLCAQGSPADAAKKPATVEMVFSIVRASNPICEPVCPEWIAADGEITKNTTKALKAILKKAGARNLPLLINSGGGDVDQAMEMGRIIRKREMTVEVARTDYLRCGPREKKCKPDGPNGIYFGYANTVNAGCYSACPLMLAGGVRRIAGRISGVGVHQILTSHTQYKDRYKISKIKNKNGKIVEKRKLIKRTLVGTHKTTKIGKKYRRKLEKYLDYVGIKKTLIDLIAETPHETIHLLTGYELKAYRLATEIQDMEHLVQYRVCSGGEPPDYCVLRE